MEKSAALENHEKVANEDLLVPLMMLFFAACAWLVYAYENRTWLNAFQQVMVWFSNPIINYSQVQIGGIPLAVFATIEVLILGLAFSNVLLSNDKDSSLKLIVAIGAGFGLTGLVVIILGIFGNLYQLPLNIILLFSIILLSAIVYKKRRKEKPTLKSLKYRLSLKNFTRPPNLKLWLPACIAIGIVFFFSFYHALLTVIVHWDATVYHAAMAVIMYKDHAIPLIAGPSIGIEMSANFPPLFSALGSYYYIQIGAVEDFFLRAIPPIMGLLTVLATYKIGEVIAGKKFGLLSALFLTFTPLFFRYSIYTTSYSILTFFCTATILFFLLAIDKGDSKYWIGSGIFYGFALLTSYVAIYLAPFLAIGLIFYYIRSKHSFKQNTKKAVFFLLPALVIGGIWYLRNLLLVGNPIYPNAYTVLGGINIDPLIMETTVNGIKLSATTSFFGANTALFDRIMIFLTYRTYFPSISLLTIFALAILPTQSKKFWLMAVWPLSLSVLVLSGISWGFPRHMVFALPGFALLSCLPIVKALDVCKRYDANHSKNALRHVRNGLPSIRKSDIIRVGFVILLLAAFLFPSLTLSMGGKESAENFHDAVPEDYLWFLKNPNSETWTVLNRLYPEAIAWNWLNDHLKEGEKVATVENRIYYIKNSSNDYFFYLDGWEARELYNITDPATMVKFLRNQNAKYILDVIWARRHGHFDVLPMANFLGSPSPYFPTILDNSSNPTIYNVGPFKTPLTDSSSTIISVNKRGWSELQSVDGVYAQSVIAGNDSARLYVGTPNLTGLNITYLDVGKGSLSINLHEPYSKEWINGYSVIQKEDSGGWKSHEFIVPQSQKGFVELGLNAYAENFTIRRIDAAPYQSEGRASLNFLDTDITNTTVPPTLMFYPPILNESNIIRINTKSYGSKMCVEIFEGIIQPWETTNWWIRHNLMVRTPNLTVGGVVNPSLIWKTEKSGLYTIVIVSREDYDKTTNVDLQIMIGGSR